MVVKHALTMKHALTQCMFTFKGLKMLIFSKKGGYFKHLTSLGVKFDITQQILFSWRKDKTFLLNPNPSYPKWPANTVHIM